VATKAPNQLSLHDMSGNIWEWRQDACTDDLEALPSDGRPYDGPGTERRLRGGCHHNRDLRVIAETEREKGKKALLALASERRAA
jgi:formylglycine-generating enzyme required for sulfatase activity